MSYTTATKGMLTGLTMLIIAIGVFGGIVLLGWKAGWWFTEQNTQKRDQIYDQSYGRQQALKDQVTKNIALISTITVQISQAPDNADPLVAQRKQVLGMVCSDAVKINPSNPLRDAQARFVEDNCDAGAPDTTSVYMK